MTDKEFSSPAVQKGPCRICPRECGARRYEGMHGYCGASDSMVIARAAPHMWEEPSISGTHGAGAVFFCGCPLHCLYCQNYIISGTDFHSSYDTVSIAGLCRIMLSLQEKGVHCIDLVSPTQYTSEIAEALRQVKKYLKIPVVWNTGGYEKTETIRMLDGLVDIFLPDLKYKSSEISEKYSNAPDYFEYASKAIEQMFSQTGPCRFDKSGMMQKGVIVRHMVIPSCRHDNMEILKYLAETFKSGDILISLMRQYTPNNQTDKKIYPELSRKLTSFEYQSVLELASELGLKGYMQEEGSAESKFLPEFDGTGVP